MELTIIGFKLCTHGGFLLYRARSMSAWKCTYANVPIRLSSVYVPSTCFLVSLLCTLPSVSSNLLILPTYGVPICTRAGVHWQWKVLHHLQAEVSSLSSEHALAFKSVRGHSSASIPTTFAIWTSLHPFSLGGLAVFSSLLFFADILHITSHELKTTLDCRLLCVDRCRVRQHFDWYDRSPGAWVKSVQPSALRRPYPFSIISKFHLLFYRDRSTNLA